MRRSPAPATEEKSIVDTFDEQAEAAAEKTFRELLQGDQNLYNHMQAQDQTRQDIAILFVRCFFIIIGALLLLTLTADILLRIQGKSDFLSASDLKDLLTVLGSILGTPLGIVLVYYFKNNDRS